MELNTETQKTIQDFDERNQIESYLVEQGYSEYEELIEMYLEEERLNNTNY